MSSPKRFFFADFELDNERRRLFRNGEPVALKSKTFDLMLAMIERRGEILSKNELLETVWAGQIVEEGNLTVHISALRKALGEKKDEKQFIVTIPGRGYSFVAPVEVDGIRVESRRTAHIIIEEEIEELADAPDEKTGREHLGAAETINRALVTARQTVLKRPALVILALALILLAGGAGFYWKRGSAAPVWSLENASIRRLTQNGDVREAALSPDGRLFAYATAEGDRVSLWLGHTDGGSPIQIRPPAAQICMSLRFSPDGSALYFVLSDDYRQGTLYRMPVFGSAPEKVRDDVRWSITFTPDGKNFAFIRDDAEKNQSFLILAETDSSSERIVAAAPTRFGFSHYTPAFSPDGRIIAVGAPVNEDGSASKILLVNADSGDYKILTTQDWTEILGLAWHPDGSRLIETVREKTAFSAQLWQISTESGEAHPLGQDLNFYGSTINFSADGKNLLLTEMQQHSNIWIAPAGALSRARQITFGSLGQDNGWNGIGWMPGDRLVYTRLGEKGVDIWTMKTDGSDQKQLIPSGGDNLYPSATSDGRYVVFQSNRAGTTAVWRADADGSNLVQLTHETIAAQPALSPDGYWIFYNSDRTNLGRWRRLAIQGGEASPAGENDYSWAAISPDGRTMAAGVNQEGQQKLAVTPIGNETADNKKTGSSISFFDVPRLANFRLGLRWTPDGEAIAYRDWTDGIWKQNLAGGPPQKLEGLPHEKLYAFNWSPDGRQFAFSRGAAISDVVLLRTPAP